LIKTSEEIFKIPITQLAAEYEHRLRQGSKEIFHIEAFIARYMCIYKQHIETLASDLSI